MTATDPVQAVAEAMHEHRCCPMDETGCQYPTDVYAEIALAEVAVAAARPLIEREAKAEVSRLTHLLGSHADGHRCTCTMTDAGVYHGDNMHPPEWEQDPWCPTHPDVEYIKTEVAAREREAKVAALNEARAAIRDRRRHMDQYGADEQYAQALHDAWGLVSNLLRGVEREGQA